MANPEHLKILKQGVEVWNKWREEKKIWEPDLSFANLHGKNLSNANFSETNLTGANLIDTNLFEALFYKATLFRAQLSNANCTKAKFLYSILEEALLIQTVFNESLLFGARIYGVSVWDIEKDRFLQEDLVITPPGEPEITVDDLEVAQFIYLMLNNERIRNVIETITSKAVLILGRFTPERKAVLDTLKDELRRRNYLPIVFDFENVGSKSVDETVNLLARMSRFVVADVTDAKSIPQELKGFVESNPSIPVMPLILKAQTEYAMFDHFRRYPWVLPLHEYESPELLLQNIIPAIIIPAEQKVSELREK